MTQQDLFDTPAPSAFDSKTSREAAGAVTQGGGHTSIQMEIFRLLWQRHLLQIGGATDEEIALDVMKRHSCKYTSVVAARNSLVKQGIVEDSGNVRRSHTTRMPCTIWRII